MFGLPLLVMLLMYTLILDSLFTFRSPADKMLYAGIAGLCAVQVVIVGFLFYAFTEANEDNEASSAEPQVDKKGQ